MRFVLLFLIFQNIFFQLALAQVHDHEKVNLIEFSVSECKKTTIQENYEPRIIEQSFKKDQSRIHIAVLSCNLEGATGTMDFRNDTLYLLYQPKTYNNNNCNCIYSLIFIVEHLPEKDIPIKFQNKLMPFAQEYSETDATGRLINKTDKFGLKQGLWKYYKHHRLARQLTYLDGNVIKSTTFYKNGKIKKECVERNGVLECTQWNKKGIILND